MWTREVEPLWHQAGLQIEVVITEHAGHAIELAQQIDLDRIGMIALGRLVQLFWVIFPILIYPKNIFLILIY